MSGVGEGLGRVRTVPNALSALRLLGVPVFGWLVVSGHTGWAVVLLVGSGLTDYLDGMIARRWNQTSRLGALLDPAADRLYILTTLVGLAWLGAIPWWLVVILLGRDVLLAGTLPVLRGHGYGPLPVHFLGKAATTCLLYAFPLILLGIGGSPTQVAARVLGWAFAVWGTALYWWAGVLYLGQVRSLLRAGHGSGAESMTA
ncbi:MAG: CDP-alcohol phosphatidyltransferase family protein [Actinomycetes bacterium]